jgi:hypothetical protein
MDCAHLLPATAAHPTFGATAAAFFETMLQMLPWAAVAAATAIFAVVAGNIV